MAHVPMRYGRDDDEGLPGGKAHTRRGELSHELALKFVESHPIGTLFTAEQFDAWTETAAGTQTPDPQDTIAWKGHVQRRQDVIKRINAAATHPRMWESEKETYEIICVRAELYEVRPIEISRTAEKHIHGLLSLLEHYRRETNHRLQATKWHELPPQAIGLAQHYVLALAYFADSIERQMNIQQTLAQQLQRSQQQIGETRKTLLPPSPLSAHPDA